MVHDPNIEYVGSCNELNAGSPRSRVSIIPEVQTVTV